MLDEARSATLFVWRPMTEDPKKPLGRILVRQHAVTQPELDKALEGATPDGPPLATRMIEAGALSEIAALKALSEQSGVPGIDLNQVCVKLRDLDIVPREVAIRHKLLPVMVREDRVFVAMASPTEKKVIDEIEFVTGKRVFPYVALAGPLMRVINAAYEMRDRGEAFYVGPRCPPEVQRKAGALADEAAPFTMGETPRPPAQPAGADPAHDAGRAANLPPSPPPAATRKASPPPLPKRPPPPPLARKSITASQSITMGGDPRYPRPSRPRSRRHRRWWTCRTRGGRAIPTRASGPPRAASPPGPARSWSTTPWAAWPAPTS